MRHSNAGKKFSRTPSHRKALLRNLAKALLSHGKIRTTETKAKELRGIVEPLITLALRNDLHARRQAYRALGSHSLVKRLFDEIAPVFAGVPGGYTRVVKLAQPRRGDSASLAIIELTRKPGEQHAPEETKSKSAKPAKTVGAIEAAPPKAVEVEVETSTEGEAEAPAKPKRTRKKAEPAPEAE
ncbi:MAG: 50S ribosomal protein L17 [Deltaproteobacteria bacterium]|jgi:large subunit ribosomal protein L17|nr:50S ribosomal protein L17 [Deltaproteobacteria bacterium]